jgi:hypothetical protein
MKDNTVGSVSLLVCARAHLPARSFSVWAKSDYICQMIMCLLLSVYAGRAGKHARVVCVYV